MDFVMGIITGIRNVRGEMNIQPSLSLAGSVQSEDASMRGIAKRHKDIIINLGRLKSFVVDEPGARPKAAATAVVEGATIFVSLEGIIDFNKEVERLEKDIAKLSKDLRFVSKKLNNEDFLSKAPEEVVEKTREKHSMLLEKEQKLRSTLDRIRAMDVEPGA
jgi:valyl-tRNA synthetase